MRFSEDFLREIKARVRLSDVIGRSVRLKKQGREFSGLSPFNKEKSASFFVNDQKGFYHCFSSGKHGDAIDFMMEVERLSFPEAVQRLAEAAGVPIPEETAAAPDPAKKSRFEAMLAALEDATRFFEAELRRQKGAEARAYLAKRQLPEADWSIFRLGWAPNSRHGLRDHLGQAGHARDIAVEAGLLIAPDDGGEPYDRFRGRIMFPICDPRGRLVAFGGRTLDPNERAKYLNSPETPLFEKGRLLYRFPEARKASGADKNARIVIAEGYMDVIALERAGIAAVAPLGTALTEDQLALLWRVSPEPVLCFDGDAAGQRAAFRTIDRALPKVAPGRTLRFAALPDKLDPDDLIRDRGAAAMVEVLDQASPMSEMLWRRELEREALDTPERRAGLRARLRAAVKEIVDADVRNAYIYDIKSRLDALYGDANPQPRDEWRGQKQFYGKSGSGGSGARGGGRPGGKGDWRNPPPRASLELKNITASSRIRPDRRIRDILLEAVRRPHLVPEGAEMLAALVIQDADLDSLRHALLDAFHFGDPIDVIGLRRHLLGRGADSAAALLERFSVSAEDGPLDAASLAAIDEEWMQALSAAARLSELERDAAESRAMLAREHGGSGLQRHSRIAAEWRGEADPATTQNTSPFGAARPGESAGYDDFEDYGHREIELGDEGEN